MKKIMAILISLLFLGSVIGIASVAAKCYLPDVTTVRVGDAFTVYRPCSICDEGYLELVGISGEYDQYYTFRALKPGKVRFCASCESDIYCATVTILPKSYPMDWIMKKFGLGKNK